MRAFQGIGGAGLYSLPIICLHEIIPRPKWQIIGGAIALTLSISYVLGPSLGGVIPHLSSWRLLYLIKYVQDSTYPLCESQPWCGCLQARRSEPA